MNHNRFTPYINAGLRFVQVEFNNLNLSGLGSSGSNDEDTVFAHQIGIGVGYAVNEKVTIDVKCGYFGTENSEYNITEAEIASNNYFFG